ncbi:Wadjet anti-phage system protein JetD domain-containing protein [Pedococcus bigeumensis]|uniref:Wadjet anti-phage system protein JetD domain-containing protein n=1 Tax=Pedococcus bigeumensis TaxID=433644 RepID=UPI002FE8FB84
MKTPEQVVEDIGRRLARTWASTIVSTDDPAWPHAFPIGQPTASELASGYASTFDDVTRWRTWSASHNVPLTSRTRRIHGTDQQLPTHAHVPDIDIAAQLSAGGWPERIRRGRHRAAVLQQRYPHAAQSPRILTAVEPLSDLDFDLLCRAADWFATNQAHGLTPRQVPIEGLHAKWLNSRQALVAALAAVDDLGLLPRHPPRLHFTYLDPDHRAAGRRLHDCATVGDQVSLAYQPRVVVISENKDTAIHFPAVADGIAVEGMGRGGATAAAFEWIRNAPRVFYWGDMDADGLEILDGFRAAGILAESLFMDPGTYDTWERFGTNLDPGGRPLEARAPRPVPHLTSAESELYHQLTSPAWPRHRRIEQERIPLATAAQEVLARVQRD